MKTQTYDFGVDPTQSENHFYVLILPREAGAKASVKIYERYSWTHEDEQILNPEDKLRLELSKQQWSAVKAALTTEFNARLKKEGLKIGKFLTVGGTAVERLFGKEMMVLLWAIEECDLSVISTAIRNWKGLLPEERWWLYTMTNASTGELRDKKGWRRALRFALCENPVVERPLFDFEMEEICQ